MEKIKFFIINRNITFASNKKLIYVYRKRIYIRFPNI